MAPKAKKAKKTKEELEAERAAAEEAARLAEEERLRLEEEERQRLAELEAQRQELLGQLLAKDKERCSKEKDEAQPLLASLRAERARATEQAHQDWEWERYLSCTHVPHPCNAKLVAAFKAALAADAAAGTGTLPEALVSCGGAYRLIDDGRMFVAGARLAGDAARRASLAADAADAHALVGARLDGATARLLAFADEHSGEKGEINVGAEAAGFGLAVWVNTSKNPRMKVVEMPSINMVVDIPKQIALASVAMRCVRRPKDEFFNECTNEYMALGGVLYADLLSLPPPARNVATWTVRPVTPLSSQVHRVPYPIPPAGADPLTFRSEEEPPPLGFTLPFDASSVVLGSTPLTVGWWEAETKSWSTKGMSGVSFKPDGQLSFQSTRMGALAVLGVRGACLPYRRWYVRPAGGRGGPAAHVTLDIGGPALLSFECGEGGVSLSASASEAWPPLAPLVGRRMHPGVLLAELSARGLHLLPDARDAERARVVPKDAVVEAAMCEQLAMLAGVCLIARARWNQAAAPDECIARVSEVLDWEEGGRTEQHHAERVFTKEREDGEKRVLSVMARGTRGFAFVDALDKRDVPPSLPGHESVEAVAACMETVYGEVHDNLFALLAGPEYTNEELAAGPLPARLRISEDGLAAARTTSALLSEAVSQLLQLLRVFSFS